MAGGFCERANRRGMFGDEYVSAAHPLFVAAADRLRHAERALSHHAQPPSTDATSTPPRLCCRPRRSRCRPRSGASHTHSTHACQFVGEAITAERAEQVDAVTPARGVQKTLSTSGRRNVLAVIRRPPLDFRRVPSSPSDAPSSNYPGAV